MRHHPVNFQPSKGDKGFSLIELLVGVALITLIVVGALAIYSKSNMISVDQQQYTQIQHDVRSSTYLVSRDLRMAGVGIPQEFLAYVLAGVNNENQGGGTTVQPDRLSMMGNMEDPLVMRINNYLGNASVVLDVDDYSFEHFPYEDSFYMNKLALILPNPASGCTACAIREIGHVTHNANGTNERFNFQPGLSDVNPPGGLSGECADSNNYDGGSIMFINVKQYWLDVTGNAPGLNAGVDGYIGGGFVDANGNIVNGNVLYMTENGVHFPLAQDIENLQFEYDGDLDDNGTMDGFVPWNPNWTLIEISRIRQIRVLILGRTPNRFVGVSGTPPGGIQHYRRPTVSDDIPPAPPPGVSADDMHRRFLIETASNIRNMSLNLYNSGVR